MVAQIEMLPLQDQPYFGIEKFYFTKDEQQRVHSGKSSDTDIAYLSFNDLVLLLFMFLVTLSMLTDRAGCYNVREKKTHCTQAYLYRQFLRNCHLLRARRRSTLLMILSYIRIRFFGNLNNYKSFTMFDIALYVYFPRARRRFSLLAIFP